MQPREQSIELGALDDFLQQIQSRHNYLVQTTEPGQLLHHYTDLSGLAGIVTNHDLWLTNSSFCNDEAEVKHGVDVATRIVARSLRRAKRRRPRDGPHIEYLERLAGIVAHPPPEGFYICCFCEESNLLSQWRSYGADGTGVSLAFDPMEFTALTGPDMPLGLMRLWRVFYKVRTQENIVQSAIDFVPELRRGTDPETMARQAADAIQFFIPTFKNADFAEEKERRLIFSPYPGCATKPRYRTARGMLVPYYSIRDLTQGAANLPLRRITIGPSVRKDLNAQSAGMLLAQNDYQGVAVEVSDTPYRS